MGTKLRKFKYSFFTKFLCWLTAVALFCLTFVIAIKILVGGYFLGFEKVFEGKDVPFFETYPVVSQVNTDFYRAFELARQNTVGYTKAFNTNKTKVVNKIADRFLDDKAGMIKSELEYAVKNFDSDYYEYDDTIDLTLPEEYTTSVYVPEAYPENVKLAMQILANAEGREFLKYDALVRADAFADGPNYYESFSLDNSDNGAIFEFSLNVAYGYTEENVKKYIAMCYDEQAEAFLREYRADPFSAEELSRRVNFKYYIENYDGEVYSNIPSIPINLSNYNNYILNTGRNIKVSGFENYEFDATLKENPCKKLCIYIDESFSGDDIYGRLYRAYNTNLSKNYDNIIVWFTICLILSIIMLVVWLCLCGHKADSEKPVIAMIDKMPNDLHFILSFGVIGSIVFLVVYGYFDNLPNILLSKPFIYLLYVCVAVCVTLFTEWLASVVRIKKAGESYFKNTLIARLICLIIKPFKKMKAAFSYKPKKMKIQTVLCFIGYIIVNAASLIIGIELIVSTYAEIFGLLLLIWNVFFNVFVIYTFTRFINQLDKIIEASSGTEGVDFGGEKVPEALSVLADNISDNNEKLNIAIAEAVKKEHMKTQLITNVSHDLKTPLTSLISYSDLLSKCDIDDEDANKYIEVINQQSIKLKRLVEDLIEASKVSTGNVTLNKTKINLYELAVQAIVEFTPDFEKNGNEVKLTEPEKPPIVFADGTKTYRIFSNLLSNCKKYSAPDTRIYATVYNEGDYGCFEIKNISKEPLNISADELTERFVRGDESRTNDGNGLGLSIAKDLCNLQNGVLEIVIDGDLFKAVVKLPIKE